MKKFLSLVLALVMTMSLVTVANAAGFTDDSKINYDEAVDVIAALDIVGGYADGSFNPQGTLTRGAAAKIICNILLTPDVAEVLSADAAPFKDVPADSTFAGYIAYCAQEGIINGYADGTFRPAGTLTGNAFMKMLLGALGYDSTIEQLTGDNWTIKVAQLVKKLKLAKGTTYVGSKAITREEACLFAFNTLNAQMVEYADKGQTITINGIVIANGASAASNKDADGNALPLLREEKFDDLKTVPSGSVDAFGRPATTWKLQGETSNIGTYAKTAAASYTTSVKKVDLVDELDADGYAIADTVSFYTNSKTASTTADNFKNIANATKLGGVGTLMELYDTTDDKVDNIDTIVLIDTQIAQVTNFGKDRTTTAKVDERTIITTAGTVAAKDKIVTNFDEMYDTLEKEDWVLVTIADSKIQTVEVPETIEGKVSQVANGKAVIDGETYNVAAQGTATADSKSQTVWMDSYGNVIKTEVGTSKSDVVYIAKVYTAADKYNTNAWYAQVVTAEGEVEELLMAAPSATENTSMTTATTGAYTYTTNSDGEAVFTVAITTGTAPEIVSVTGKIEDDQVRVAGKYLADGLMMIYIKDSGAKLTVETANGLQNVASAAAGSYAVLDKNGEVAAVVILAAPDAIVNAEDLLFVTNTTPVGTGVDLKGNSKNVYEYYENGEKTTAMMTGAPTAGWNKYSVDSKTGAYTLTAVTENAYTGIALTGASINQDKYISLGTVTDVVNGVSSTKTLNDIALAADCAIYDLTENDVTTLAALDDLMEVEMYTGVTIAATYDKDAEVITAIYVTAATAPAV